uniref:Rho guanine nucleotide exchange factor 18 n=1 Tax=Trichogramma kaykai TaxID=54128 RepID=A0ABD2XQX9_9HYME
MYHGNCRCCLVLEFSRTVRRRIYHWLSWCLQLLLIVAHPEDRAASETASEPPHNDECPNSGEDSEEDVIKDYLGGSGQIPECSPPSSRVNGIVDESTTTSNNKPQQQQQQQQTSQKYNSHDEGCLTTGGASSKDQNNAQQQQQQQVKSMSGTSTPTTPGTAGAAGMATSSSMTTTPTNPLVPIISVTPHSPGLAKHYPVLEEPLRHLHEIHDRIHQMRDLTLRTGAQAIGGDHLARFSTSCPQLCPLISIEGVIQTGGIGSGGNQQHYYHQHNHHRDCQGACGAGHVVVDGQDGSDPDLLTNCSTNSSPTHYHHHHHGSVGGGGVSHVCSQILQGIDRRRSWTDLEDSRQHGRRGSDNNHLTAQNIRQRSISLSSLDSDMDMELDGKRPRETSSKPRTSVSQSSTHSLNEADFVQVEFKVTGQAKRSGQRLGDNASLMPGMMSVLGSRLPLQKSVSTPSIVIPPAGQQQETGTRGAPSHLATKSGARHERNRHSEANKQQGAGSGSDTETDEPHHLLAHERHEYNEDLMREGVQNTQASLDELLTDTAYDDRQSEKTKRKRGSLFSRKKKDKSGKKTTQPHQWGTINVSSQGNNSCDFCMKPFASKPSFHCENCGAIIHQNCKDHYQAECTKTKSSSKSSFKSLSSVSISSTSSIVKRASTASLPLAASSSTGRDINSKKAVTSYSPWRRVATKLGVNQTISEERDGDGGSHRDVPSSERYTRSVEQHGGSGVEEFDFDDTQQFSLEEFDQQRPELALGREEPDSWSAAVGRKAALKLCDNNEREIKRQEHIYEFILTEKHHCLVLLAMQRIFVDGLQRHFNFSVSVLDRMFPKLQALMDIHFDFLAKLRQRQSESPVVPSIADILCDQFSGDNSYGMKSAYGEFCSRHRDAVDVYKQHQQMDARFARFVRHCQNNPLLKKKGIPECILFVTQRLTKYPLLIDPLIKTSTAQDETDDLRRALALVKDILNEVDTCVADKERTDRKLDIYHKIDPKSCVTYRGNKFKKSDILDSNRNLKFEGTAWLMQGRNKMVPVVVVCLTDILFFLTGEQKYVFFVPDNKAGVVSLQKLLVREKAGQESRGIYLISSNPTEPEMFELKVKEPRDKHIWIKAIRAAVEACPQEPENESSNFIENNLINDLRDTRPLSMAKLTPEEKLRLAKETRLQSILEELKKKDEEQTMLFEQKMALHLRLHNAISVSNSNDNDIDKNKDFKEVPDYLRFARGENINPMQMYKEALDAMQQAMRLTSSLSCGAGGGSLSRSLSSAGERHSQAYVHPSVTVPRRAETFAGFDHNKERHARDAAALINAAGGLAPSRSVSESGQAETLLECKVLEDDPDGNKDQREVAVRLSHYVQTLLGVISYQMTSIESLQAQLAGFKEGSIGKSSQVRANPNRQLEELRNLQDQLCREKAEFRASSQQERAQLDEERAELQRLRNQLTVEQRDVEKQRDQLYRWLEAQSRQGVVPLNAAQLREVTGTQNTRKKNEGTEKSMNIPQHLFSATNQQKVQQLPVKQQLPLKLASGSNNNSRTSLMSNNSPDRHSRAGSSPAIVSTSSSGVLSPELGVNNGSSSSLSHFSMSNRSLRGTRIPEPYSRNKHHSPQQQPQQAQPQQPQQQSSQQQHSNQQQQPMEEEVLFL